MTDTEENIINALFQLANKYPKRSDFTISEIAKEAKISRQAIYQKYFRNKNDILSYLHDMIDREVIKVLSNYKSDDNDPFIYFANKVLPAIYKYKDWLKYLYSTAVDPSWSLFLKERYYQWIVNNISFNTTNSMSQKFLAQIIVGNILSIIEAWMTQDIPDHPQKFAKTFLTLINNPLHNLIKIEK